VPTYGPDWSALAPGIALWALALYLPLSGPLGRLEASLAEGSLPPALQQLALVVSSLLLALAMGVVSVLVVSWALGPGWASSLGLLTVLAGGFWTLASRVNGEGNDPPDRRG
jgi:predicted ABC-type sugar transport system permease subunit